MVIQLLSVARITLIRPKLIDEILCVDPWWKSEVSTRTNHRNHY
jgi:hypothetical protein